MAPSRGQCTREPRLHLPSGREPAVPPPALPLTPPGAPPPQSSASLFWVRVHVPFPSGHCLLFGDSDPFNWFPVFSGIDYWQSAAYFDSQKLGQS